MGSNTYPPRNTMSDTVANLLIRQLRQSTVQWIVKWFIATEPSDLQVVITEGKKTLTFNDKVSNRTVILNTRDANYLLHFMIGRNESNVGYFTMEIGFDSLTTLTGEVIFKYLKGDTQSDLVDLVNKSHELYD